MIRLHVLGLAQTQGNKRPMRNKHTGRINMIEGRSKEATDRFHSWRDAVRGEGQDAAKALLPEGPFVGPVAVRCRFGMQRPASEPKTRRTWPVKARSGDVDKLARAVLDALTGVLFADDSQVVELRVTKDWSARPGVTVDVFGPHELTDLDARDVADNVRAEA